MLRTWALLSLLPCALVDAAECYVYGVAYSGNEVVIPVPTMSAEHCQQQCVGTYLCAHFTWRADSNSTAGYMKGDCRKYDEKAALVPVDGIANHTISGPRLCPSGSSTATPTVPATPTLVPLPTPGLIFNGTPTLAPAMNATNCTGSFCEAEGAEAGGGFPWWAILLIILVVLGVAAAVMYGSCADSGKKKKKKDKKKKTSSEIRDTSFANESGEGEALVAPAPMAAPAEAPAASPVATASPAAMVAPAATFTPAQPLVYTSGGQVVVQQPAPGVNLQMPVMSGGARQLQVR